MPVIQQALTHINRMFSVSKVAELVTLDASAPPIEETHSLKQARPAIKKGQSVIVLSGYSAFLLAANLAGPITPAFSRLLTLVALAVIVWWTWRVSTAPIYLRSVFLLSPALYLLLTTIDRNSGESLPVFCVTALLIAAAYLTRHADEGVVMWFVARSVALVALVLVGVRHIPYIWLAMNAVAYSISLLAGVLIREPLQVGPTFCGIWVALMYAFMIIPEPGMIAFGRKSYLRAAAFFLLQCVVAIVGYVALLPFIETLARSTLSVLLELPEPHQPLELDPGVVASVGAGLPLLALLIPARRFISQVMRPIERTGSRRLMFVLGAVVILCVAYKLTATPIPAAPNKPIVAFYDPGDMDWSVPTKGRYGLGQVGMFGAMREYLQAVGYQTTTIPRDFTLDDLNQFSAVAIINLRERLSDSSRQIIWEYVERGGGLLVLGDHSDIWGIQAPLNHLLEPVAIRFEFDSAFPLRRHWRYCQEFRPHPITADLVDQRDTQIETGASLIVDNRRAQDIVVGRYAFSDLGNRANGGRGGFLGDYRYEPGERLGDVVLATSVQVGSGRVVIFGDTTSFQTLALPKSYAFVEHTFRYLSARTQSHQWMFLLLACLMIAGVVVAIAGKPPIAMTMLMPLLILAADGSHGLFKRPQWPPLNPSSRTAILDTTHVERFPVELFENGSMGGILAAFYRGGYLPVIHRDESSPKLDGVGLVAYIAPTRPFSSAEINDITRFLEQGGTLLLAGSSMDRGVANQLLSVAGLRLGNQPLGAVKIEQGNQVIQFVDAYPLEPDGSRPIVIHTAWENYILVAEVKVGAGRCIAIGDPLFFTDENLEGEFRFQPGNVSLIEKLLAGNERP